MKPRVLAICGTRPDTIKMAPVLLELFGFDDMETRLAVSGQHSEMLSQALEEFGLIPDADFAVMKPRQSLAYLTSAVLEALDSLLNSVAPQMVIAQGDTTTTFVAALASFYRKIPFAHVEAGLRTQSVEFPFPEEFNRRATAQVTSLHFAPTQLAKANLIGERVPPSNIVVTGNTSIDAVLLVTKKSPSIEPFAKGRMLLVTTHRRENWGEPQRRICFAVKRILKSFDDVHCVVPMHKNEAVREVLSQELEGVDRVFLVEPPGYSQFAKWMQASYLILTDSGGIQEEAPALGKPVLVLRDETERPEGIRSGNAKLVGTDPNRIFEETSHLLSDTSAYSAMSHVANPYGDGRAATRIVASIRQRLGLPFESITEFDG